MRNKDVTIRKKQTKIRFLSQHGSNNEGYKTKNKTKIWKGRSMLWFEGKHILQLTVKITSLKISVSIEFLLIPS